MPHNVEMYKQKNTTRKEKLPDAPHFGTGKSRVLSFELSPHWRTMFKIIVGFE
jgi:hypothetical protein